MHSKVIQWQERLFEMFSSKEKGNQLDNIVIPTLIVLSVAVAILGTVPNGVVEKMGWIERIFTLIFCVEFILRRWASLVDPKRIDKGISKSAWILRSFKYPLNWIDLLSFAPAMMPGVDSDDPVIIVFRVMRLLRLARYSTVDELLIGAFTKAWPVLRAAFTSAGVAITLGATLLWSLEKDLQPDKFGSIPDALWWSAVTYTTVGYGDIYPVTHTGRIVAFLLMLAAMVLIPIVGGAFVDAFQQMRKELKESEISTGI